MRDSTDNIVTQIIRKREDDKPPEEKDPIVLVARDIITNAIRSDCQKLAKECIQQVSLDYLEEIHINKLIKEKYFKKAIEEVAMDSIEEVIVETIFDEMQDKLTKELVNPLAANMFQLA